MKKVLITAGQVYGPLDGNKVVGNRARGVWATRFAEHLAELDYEVVLLVPDINTPILTRSSPRIHLVIHQGYWDYAEKCASFATEVQGAVLAAAVVNWIPETPFPGKMPTSGFAEGDVIQVPFTLAPRVINRMKDRNPDITLIGCKLLVGSTLEQLVEAAYRVLLSARCNAVVANDLESGLRTKHLVHQDRTVTTFADDFPGLFEALRTIIDDAHYRTATVQDPIETIGLTEARQESASLFDRILDRHREGFTPRETDGDLVFGSLAVPVRLGSGRLWHLLSPREKGRLFSSSDAVVLTRIDGRAVHVLDGKATLNAPLLIRMLRKFPEAVAVLHQHRNLPGVPTVPHAPPGTVRDNDRDIPGLAFNIAGHGFVACLDDNLEIIR